MSYHTNQLDVKMNNAELLINSHMKSRVVKGRKNLYSISNYHLTEEQTTRKQKLLVLANERLKEVNLLFEIEQAKKDVNALQLDYHLNRSKYHLWGENEDRWFDTFDDVRNHLKIKRESVRTSTLTHTQIRSLQKSGIRVYKENKNDE